MARISWERAAALAGLAFVVSFVAAFSLGIEVGPSDREILAHYADSGSRAQEVAAFFVLAAAALAFLLFAVALRSVIARAERETAMLAALTLASGSVAGALFLTGNAVSRATAFAATEEEFRLDPDTRRLFEDAGLLILVGGALAAILLVVAVSLAALRHGVLSRWVGWAGFPVAALLPLAVAFLGFLVLFVWVLAVSINLLVRRQEPAADPPGAVPEQSRALPSNRRVTTE
jgi:hypothetical protein